MPSSTRADRPRVARPLVLVAAAAAVAIIAGASGALAGGSFTDVSESSPFFEDIEAIAGAGITTGYADGTYRPGANVSRQAMAAFMNRGFSRVGSAWTPEGVQLDINEPDALLAEVLVEAGAASSGQGYVLLIAQVDAYTGDAASCPCTVEATIARASDFGDLNEGYLQVPGEPGTDDDFADTTATLVAAVPIPADTDESYGVFVDAKGFGVDQVVETRATLTALYVPFATSDASAPMGPEGPEPPLSADGR